jgi:hypothetical protein
MRLLGLEPTLLRSRADALAEAYALQASRVAYVESPRAAASDSGR